jgi:hypothetical protein
MTLKLDHSSPILICCEAGLDRSAAFKIELVAQRGYNNILNCGVETVSPATLQMLGAWAKVIFVIADESVWKRIPWDLKGKSIFENIGKDIWHSPDNPLLKKICKQIASKYKL